MPGNHNSGRKKCIKQNVQQEDDPLQKKKKPGRPKKEVTVVLSDNSFAQGLPTDIETASLHSASSESSVQQIREDRSVQSFHLLKPLWHDVIHRTTSVMEVKHRSIEIVLGWGTD